MEIGNTEESLHAAESAERRREPRFSHTLSIEVSGFDCAGRFFTERTCTIDASMCGCRFTLRTSVERGSVLAIRLVDPQTKADGERRTVLFQVAHTQQSDRVWIVGVWRMQSSRLWTLEFDSASQSTVNR